MLGIMLVKCFAVIFAFPCSVILLTNSAVSLRILGTLNGFAVSISAVGRAVGPALGGAAFTWGLEKGYVVTPWWMLGIIAAGGAVPIWYLVEMDGFSKTGGDEESDDEDVFGSEDEDEEGLDDIPEDRNREILEGDEIVWSDEEDLDVIDGPAFSKGPDRRKSFEVAKSSEAGSGRRRSISNLERRMSSPVGIRGGSVGPGGGRKLSNGLAASNFGQGTGGTSFT